MMSLMHIAFNLGLIALAVGVFLYVWSLQHKGHGTGVAKFFGIIIVVLSIVGLLCSWYTGMRVWKDGMPMPMMEENGKAEMHHTQQQ